MNKNRQKWLVCFFLLLFIITGCKDFFHTNTTSETTSEPTSDGSNGSGSGSGSLIGTWVGRMYSAGYPFDIRLEITRSGWTLSDVSYGGMEHGTYTMNGTSADLMTSDYGYFATVVLYGPDTILVTNNYDNITLYRQ
jgi:hypothetical protein